MLITVYNKAIEFQCLIHVCVLIFLFSSLLIGWKIKKKAPKPIQIISNSTLEIYVVQVVFGYLCQNFSFPLNWFVFFLIAIGGGISLKQLTNGPPERRVKQTDHRMDGQAG